MAKVSSVYDVGLEIHNQLKASFIGEGKTVRQLALEHGLAPMQILNFMRWAAREHDIERRMRADLQCGTLLKLSQALLDRALIEIQKGAMGLAHVETIAKLVEQVNGMHAALAKETETWQALRLSRRRFRKGGRKGDEGSDADAEELPLAEDADPGRAFDEAIESLEQSNGPRKRRGA